MAIANCGNLGYDGQLGMHLDRTIMLNEERLRAILEVLRREGRVLVPDLAQRLKTSQVTIRRDLDVLHQQRRLHRSHGGALPARDGMLEVSVVREKERTQCKERTLIAAAVRMVKEGQVIALDSGATATEIARSLRYFRNLTIITNGLAVVAELAGSPVEVILIGGTLCKSSFSVVGPIAEETLQHLNADLLFLGVDGRDVEYGLSNPNLLESKVNQAMLAVAGYRVVVCDSSKVRRRSLSFIATLSSVHEIITDGRIPKSDADALKKAGVHVTIV